LATDTPAAGARYHGPAQPWRYRAAQWSGAALLALMPALGLALAAIGLATGGLLFVVMGALIVALVAPVLHLVSATPPVTVDAAGLTLHPLLWRARRLAWAEVTHLTDYPLLPGEAGEVFRQRWLGPARYTPASGLLLVIPTLPAQYRVTGWMAGVGGPAIAVTNRTHADYAALAGALLEHLPYVPASPAPDA
jgi:hypothetical protein